jgi:predicted porin
MKKTLIALAALASIGSAFAADVPAAPAVTVYGLIDISYNRDTSAGAPFSDGLLLNDKNSGSRVGLKGSADVGSGIKANFNLEAGHILITAKPASEAFFNRQAWAGLSSEKFGEVRAGTQDSVAFQTHAGFDLNGAANDSQASGLSGVPTVGNSGTTLAQYITPALGGFKAQLGYMPKGDNQALTGDLGSKASYAVAGSYAAGPLAAAVSYQSASTDTIAAGSSLSNNLTIVSGSYDFTVAKLVATYANGGDGIKGYNLGLAVPVAGASVGAQYSKNTDTNNTGIELFANKEVLKNVTAYVDIGKKHIDKTSADSDLYSLGLIWTF